VIPCAWPYGLCPALGDPFCTIHREEYTKVTEAQHTTKFLTQVKGRFPRVFAYKINDRVTAGVPDAIIVKSQRTVWLEMKACAPDKVGDALSDLQKHTLQKLAAAGAEVYVLCFAPNGTQHVFLSNLVPVYAGKAAIDFLFPAR
jgi:hypothetical protein